MLTFSTVRNHPESYSEFMSQINVPNYYNFTESALLQRSYLWPAGDTDHSDRPTMVFIILRPKKFSRKDQPRNLSLHSSLSYAKFPSFSLTLLLPEDFAVLLLHTLVWAIGNAYYTTFLNSPKKKIESCSCSFSPLEDLSKTRNIHFFSFFFPQFSSVFIQYSAVTLLLKVTLNTKITLWKCSILLILLKSLYYIFKLQLAQILSWVFQSLFIPNQLVNCYYGSA